MEEWWSWERSVIMKAQETASSPFYDKTLAFRKPFWEVREFGE